MGNDPKKFENDFGVPSYFHPSFELDLSQRKKKVQLKNNGGDLQCNRVRCKNKIGQTSSSSTRSARQPFFSHLWFVWRKKKTSWVIKTDTLPHHRGTVSKNIDSTYFMSSLLILKFEWMKFIRWIACETTLVSWEIAGGPRRTWIPLSFRGSFSVASLIKNSIWEGSYFGFSKKKKPACFFPDAFSAFPNQGPQGANLRPDNGVAHLDWTRPLLPTICLKKWDTWICTKALDFEMEGIP